MAYFDNTNNTSLYSTSISGDFDAYLFLSQTSTNEEANISTYDTFRDDWNIGGQPDHMVGSPRILQAEASFGSMPSVSSYATRPHDYEQQPFPGYYWPIIDGYSQSHHSGIVSWDSSFAGTVASEASTVVAAPSSIPLNCWGDHESEPSAGTLYENVQTLHQHGTGLARTEMAQTLRLQPYGVPTARSNEHTNAEAGPSTLTPPFLPCMALPAMHPPGGTSETMADAKDQTITEEDTTPTTRRPRSTGKVRDWRIRYQRYTRRLCIWAQGWIDLRKPPSHERALRTALGVVGTIRARVYSEPRLIRGIGKRSAQGKRVPDAEHRGRGGTRELYEELSQYYKLPTTQAVWGCPELLLKVLDDVESRPKPPVEASA